MTTPVAPVFDPALVDFLTRSGVGPRASFADMAPPEARAVSDAFLGLFSPGPDVEFEDRLIPGAPDVAVRVYTPSDPPKAVIVYLHGGGWVLGSVKSFDPIVRTLTVMSGALMVLVDYRLAPEHAFPAPLHDAWTAVQWTARLPEVDDQQIPLAVMGDSAGGNLAAVVARWARDEGLPVRAQILLYPVIDRRFDSPSYDRFADGFGLSRREMQWFWNHYAGGTPTTADLAPIAADDLHGLPPAGIVAAEIDVLRSEADAYATALVARGVPVVSRLGQGLPHGFLSFINDVPSVHALVSDFFRSVDGLLR